MTRVDLVKFCEDYPMLSTGIANNLSWGNVDDLIYLYDLRSDKTSILSFVETELKLLNNEIEDCCELDRRIHS